MPSLSRQNPDAFSPSSLGPRSEPAASIETNGSQPPSFQASLATAPAISLSSPPALNTTRSGPPPHPGFGSTDLEEPPPYTPNASITSGETTIEVGPTRPFRTVQPSTNLPRNGLSQAHNQVTHRISNSSSSSLPSSSRPAASERTASIFQQLSNSLNNVVNNLNSTSSSHSSTNNYNWGAASVRPIGQSKTGQNAPYAPPRSPPPNARLAPPPQHPLSSSASLHPPPLSTSSHSLPSMANHSSDFSRDFYAVGSGSGEALASENIYAPPVGPPPLERQSSTTHSALQNDGRPTSQPKPGHPLLKDGKLLVYPKGYACEKCHNVGYKDANPLKPCKSCWNKYAKPFAGPLVYSFPANTASSSPASNLQKPLPHAPPPTSLPMPAVSSSSTPRAPFVPGGYMTNHHGRFHNPPTGPILPILPVSTSVTYTAGDPRIGGRLCWRCDGKGYVSMMFLDRETCRLCSGVGRLFQ